MDQKRVLTDAQRLRANFLSSVMPNLLQTIQADTRDIHSQFNTLKPALPSAVTSPGPCEETTNTSRPSTDQGAIQLSIVVQPELLGLLDELIHMNLAADREGAAQVMLQLGSKMSKEVIYAHFDLREKLQEIRDHLYSEIKA